MELELGHSDSATKTETDSASGIRRHKTSKIIATDKVCSVEINIYRERLEEQSAETGTLEKKAACVSRGNIYTGRISLRHVTYEHNAICPE